jgi:hypothetical protein
MGKTIRFWPQPPGAGRNRANPWRLLRNKYPNPGQTIYVDLKFKYKKDIPGEKPAEPTPTKTPIDPVGDIQDYKQIKSNMIMIGSYYCNGTNGAGGTNIHDDLITPCDALPNKKRDSIGSLLLLN